MHSVKDWMPIREPQKVFVFYELQIMANGEIYILCNITVFMYSKIVKLLITSISH